MGPRSTASSAAVSGAASSFVRALSKGNGKSKPVKKDFATKEIPPPQQKAVAAPRPVRIKQPRLKNPWAHVRAAECGQCNQTTHEIDKYSSAEKPVWLYWVHHRSVKDPDNPKKKILVPSGSGSHTRRGAYAGPSRDQGWSNLECLEVLET